MCAGDIGCDSEFAAVACVGDGCEPAVDASGVATGDAIVAVGGVAGGIDDACAVGAQFETCRGCEDEVGDWVLTSYWGIAVSSWVAD